MIIRSRAPLRLGLAGGGTDLSPYCNEHGGFVLNATITRYAHCSVETVGLSGELELTSLDFGLSVTRAIKAEAQCGCRLFLVETAVKSMLRRYDEGGDIKGLKVTVSCDAPVGSGLGTSSTLVVAIIKAMDDLLGAGLDQYEIAQLAYVIEREECGFSGGRQDQYAAAFGGVNAIEFNDNEAHLVNPLRLPRSVVCELEASLVLYFMGVSRESATIISSQKEKLRSAVPNTQHFHDLKREAVTMKKALLKGEFDAMVSSMCRGWEAKKATSAAVSNKKIDEIYDAALMHGALAGKVSGAGGGGFMWFFCKPNHKRQLEAALKAFGGNVDGVTFTHEGAESWKLK